MHIATLIFLLSNKKYVIKKPGEYLNSIFIDTNEMESPNKLRNVRSKRHNASSSDSDSSSSSINNTNYIFNILNIFLFV